VRLSRNWRKAPWHLRYRVGADVASRARRMLIELTHLHCHVEFQGPVHIGPGFRLVIPDKGTLVIGAGTVFRQGFVCEIGGNGRVVIGPNCEFTSHVLLQCSTSIEVGERCAVGQSVLIVDGNHRFRDWTRHLLDQGYDDFRPVHIGDGAIVMAKVSIIGADIGTRAVIGANSVVTRSIPAYCLAYGAPARIVEYFGPPDQRPAELDGQPSLGRRRSSSNQNEAGSPSESP